MSRIPRNAEYTKEYNRKLVLRLLRGAPRSRADLARAIGLSREGVSLIVDELLAAEVLRELPPVEGGRGRAPLPLELRPDAYCAMGVYLNRDGCHVGLTDIGGTVLDSRTLALDVKVSQEETVATLAGTVLEVLATCLVPLERVIGVGVSTPGPIDVEAGRILNPPKFDLWHEMNLGSMLGERLGLPVYLENNACALALFHRDWAGAVPLEDFLLLLVDSGIGSGVISRGQLLQSAGGFTSELGHTTISFEGRACPCGNRGCLEMYAAVPNLLAEFGNRWPSWQALAEAAPRSAEAMAALTREADYLATGLVNLTNIINIRTVVLAGSVLYGYDLLVPLLTERLAGRSLSPGGRALRFLPACAQQGTDIRAAGNIAFNRFLSV